MFAGVTTDLTAPGELSRLFAGVARETAIGLAVSGGADSLALMLLAQRWAAAQPRPPRLHVYSVDHGLRPEAAGEVKTVLAAAAALGLPATPLHWTGTKPRTSIQEAARTARYRLFAAAMRQDRVPVLLTAHHRSDQAETILMRMAHGSGVEGLKGMSAFAKVEGVHVHRPLLGIDPAALLAVVKDAGLVPVLDPSNEDEHYERVRWRKALPGLSALGLDPAALAGFAQRMATADEAILHMANAAFVDQVRLDGFGAGHVQLDALRALPTAVAVRVLGRVLNIVGGRQKPRALGQVERLHHTVMTETDFKATTLLGCVVRPKDGTLMVAREPGRSTPADIVLSPNAELVWDERFLIRNGSSETGLTAGVADYLPRHRLEEFLGFKITAPAEAIRTAPIVRDSSGGVLSLGGWSFDDRIKVQLLVD